MMTTLLEMPMASSSEKPKTMPVKLAVDVIESARVVSSMRGEAMSDLLSDILRPILSKMEKDEMTRRLKAMEEKVRKSKAEQ
jgi:hypothetical protein